MTKQPLQAKKINDPYHMAGMEVNTPMLLAFSGGADSVALLDMLKKEYPTAPILLAHVNHGIRGEEALRDRAFCEQVAKAYGLEIAILDANVPKIARDCGESLEEAAREVRYAYFSDLMEKRNIPILLTAHQADDHLETILFRLARGTGLSGLSGILPIRPFANGFVVRPLLNFSKVEILQYCEENGLAFVTDSTNADTAYARNRIRADVVPALEVLYDDVAHRSVRMSADLGEDDAFLCEVAKELLVTSSTINSINIEALRRAHPAIRRRTLQMWFERGRGTSLEAVHLQTLLDLIESGDTTARVALPTGVSAYCTARGRLAYMRTKPPAVGSYTLPLTLGEQTIPNTNISISVSPIEMTEKMENEEKTVLVLSGEWETLQKKLSWRNRREGDTLYLKNMHRKLRRLYAQKGIPVEARRAMPLLVCGTQIVWAPFVGVCDDWKDQPTGANTSSNWKIEIHLSNDEV